MSEPPAARTGEPAIGRWSGWSEVLKRMLVGSVGAGIGVGLLGALIGWAADRDVSSAVAGAYYIVGCILFLVGMFPSGGFSMLRGNMTRRRPIGARQDPVFLLGIVLIALGVLVDTSF
jgi:hypothetical protein